MEKNPKIIAEGSNEGQYDREIKLYRILAGLMILILLSALSFSIRSYLELHTDQSYFIETYSDYPLGLIYYFVLLILLLLPFSPTSPVVAMALVVFGATDTFILSFLSGVSAAVLSYAAGSLLKVETNLFLRRVTKSFEKVRNHRGTFATVFLLKLVPNPLYDMVGYLCGMTGISFRLYILATAIASTILLAVICFSGFLIIQ